MRTRRKIRNSSAALHMRRVALEQGLIKMRMDSREEIIRDGKNYITVYEEEDCCQTKSC